MDNLYEQIMDSQREVELAKQEGFPVLEVRCGECGKVEAREFPFLEIEHWLRWVARGRHPINGRCSMHEDEEDEA